MKTVKKGKKVGRWMILALLALGFGWLAVQEFALVLQYGDLKGGLKVAAVALVIGLAYFAVLFVPSILEKRRKN